MKLKIDQRFIQEVASTLQQLKINHQLNEQEGMITIQSDSYSRLGFFRHFGQLIHQKYKKQSTNTQLNLNQFLKQMDEKIVDPKNEGNKLNEILLVDRVQQLKNQIRRKKEKLQKILQENANLQQTYEKMSRNEEKRLSLTITNMELRIQMLDRVSDKDHKEELERVRSVLRNGIWGCRDRIEELVQKIDELEC